jgi:hypothetical protein
VPGVSEREVEPESGNERSAMTPAAPGAALLTAAGNAAVGRLLRAQPRLRSAVGVHPGALGNRAVARMLQRYDAYEHARQGDHAKGSMTVTLPFSSGSMQGMISLTSGEINALADLYLRPEDLEQADAVELSKLKVLINRQLLGQKVEESEWDDATGGRYNRLNLKNAAHFGARNTALIDPGSVSNSGQDNRARFISFYNQTVVNAQTAYGRQLGVYDPAAKQKWLDRAVLSAGFAEHFLMDAFSAGHLFNKDDFITVLTANLNALSGKQRDSLFNSVAKGVLADPPSNTLLGKYELTAKNIPWYIGGGIWHPNLDHESIFTGLLQHLYSDTEGRQAVYSALVKVVHDALSTNPAAGGLTGVEVENDFGKWILSGDKTLATSTDTQNMIDRALEEFRRQMEQYRNGPVTGADPTADAAKLINAYFPRPTAATVALISGKVTTATDAGAGTIAALVDVMKAELPSILSALTDRGEIRKA